MPLTVSSFTMTGGTAKRVANTDTIVVRQATHWTASVRPSCDVAQIILSYQSLDDWFWAGINPSSCATISLTILNRFCYTSWPLDA